MFRKRSRKRFSLFYLSLSVKLFISSFRNFLQLSQLYAFYGFISNILVYITRLIAKFHTFLNRMTEEFTSSRMRGRKRRGSVALKSDVTDVLQNNGNQLPL
jgi:hypothetical protein